RTSLRLPLLLRLRLAAVVGGGFDAEVVPQVLLLVRVLLGRVRRHGTGPDRADAITRMDLRVEDVRAVRVTVLALQASVEGTEEVPVLRVDAAVTQRCADHRGGHVLARVIGHVCPPWGLCVSRKRIAAVKSARLSSATPSRRLQRSHKSARTLPFRWQ